MRLRRIRSRVCSSGAWRSTRSSNVRFASSIIAHSSPRISTPASANRSGSTRLSSLPSSGSPSELARRFAGSIVSTATFFPRLAMPSATAAEVVVLPTPPDPAQMQISLPSRRSPTFTENDLRSQRPCKAAHRRRSQALLDPVREELDRAHVELGAKDEGKLDDVLLQAVLEAGELVSVSGR